jgi:aminoglycoside phosphotransferase (APT) family kinase protein
MHADEVETDVDLVRRLLSVQFPQWAGLRIEPVPSTGTVNAIYRLGEDMAVRLPRSHRWASDLGKELRWLPELGPHLPLRVPEPVAAGSPDEGYPWHWAVYRWLGGETFTSDRAGDPGQAAVDLARFIAALQRIEPTGGPPSGRDEPLARRDAPTRTAIEAVRGIVDTSSATAAWEASLQATAWAGTPVWIHGDLLPPNLLVEHGRLSAVIDFGAVGLGDPACDLLPAWSVLSGAARGTRRPTVNYSLAPSPWPPDQDRVRMSGDAGAGAPCCAW